MFKEFKAYFGDKYFEVCAQYLWRKKGLTITVTKVLLEFY